MAFPVVSIPVCSGILTVQSLPAGYSLICSAPWTTSAGILIDPAYSAQLAVMLDNSGVDWDAVSWVFGSGLLLFALGTTVGILIKTLKLSR